MRDEAEEQHGSGLWRTRRERERARGGALPLLGIAVGKAALMGKVIAIRYAFSLLSSFLVQFIRFIAAVPDMPEGTKLLYLKSFLRRTFSREFLIDDQISNMLTNYIHSNLNGIAEAKVKKTVEDAAKPEEA